MQKSPLFIQCATKFIKLMLEQARERKKFNVEHKQTCWKGAFLCFKVFCNSF